MTTNDNRIFKYLYRLDREPKEARGFFEERYGFPVTSARVEANIEAAVRELDAELDADDKVSVPAYLLVAIILRPRGKGGGRKRPPKPKWARRQQNLLVRQANSNYAQKVKAGVAPKRARYLAAKEELAKANSSGNYRYAGINSIKTLESKLRLGIAKRSKQSLMKRKSN